MRASASGKGLGNSVAAYVNRAKEGYAKLSDESSPSARQLWSTMKAKAQNLYAQQVAAKRERSVGSKQRAKSAGPLASAVASEDSDEVAQICDVFSSRVSPVAARLALSKIRGGDKVRKERRVQIACEWLLDDKNIAEVEEAELADIERQAKEDLAETGRSLEDLQSPSKPSRQSRRDSRGSEDDGRGLGFFMRRRSFSLPKRPSPTKVPMPGRLSSEGRRSYGSVASCDEEERPSFNLPARRVSMGSQTSEKTEEFEDEPDRPSMLNGELDQSEDESVVDDAEETLLQRPPVSTSWDWPLSRQEKKVRVQQLETQMSTMDRRHLKQENHALQRHLRKMSIGTHGYTPTPEKPSRLSM